MARYDVEQAVRDVATMFKNNLNTKIAAINTEKGDFSISTIDSNAWFFHHIPVVWNYPVFMIYGFENLSLNGFQEDNAVEAIELFFEVAIPDTNEAASEAQVYKLLRYARALKEIAQENYDCLRGYGKIKVASLTPALIEINGKRLRSSGVTITASISSR